MRRVAVTGIGLVAPLGHDVEEVFDNALRGRSAIRPITLTLAGEPFDFLAACVDFEAGQHLDAVKLRMMDRVSQFALVAARRALLDARMAAPTAPHERTGVFVGTGMGASQTLDDGYNQLYGRLSTRIHPLTVLLGMHNAPAAWIASDLDIRGPCLTYSTACSSSAVAIGEAWLKLVQGEVDLAIAGGAEAPLSMGSLVAWDAMRTLASPDPREPAASCKPFSADRSGMVLGEGAAMLVLEPLEDAIERGAPVYGEVVGYGLVTDVVHMARPSVEAQAAALKSALRSSNLDPQDVDAINAHGTGTQLNDGVETAAIRAVFGARADRIPISATKAVHGHLLGAAGALEAVLALLAMRRSVCLPTMHLHRRDPACDLDYVANTARTDVSVHTMLSSSFAFGGTNAVLALRAPGKSVLTRTSR